MIIISFFCFGNKVLKEHNCLYFQRTCSFIFPEELLFQPAKRLLLLPSYSSLWAEASACGSVLFGREWSSLFFHKKISKQIDRKIIKEVKLSSNVHREEKNNGGKLAPNVEGLATDKSMDNKSNR